MKTAPKELKELISRFLLEFEKFEQGVNVKLIQKKFISEDANYSIDILSDLTTLCRVGHTSGVIQFGEHFLFATQLGSAKARLNTQVIEFLILWCFVKKQTIVKGMIYKSDAQCDDEVLTYLIKKKRDLSTLPETLSYSLQNCEFTRMKSRIENITKRVDNYQNA